MKSEEEINFDTEIYYIFEPLTIELKYVENTLKFLNQSLISKFEKLEEGFINDANSLYLDGYESEFLNNYPNKCLPTEMIAEDLRYVQEEEYQTHDTVSGYIIQSILVKQVSIIEKFLKSFYKYTQDKNEGEEPINKQPSFIEKIRKYICNLLCVDIKEKKQFSDIKEIVTAITKITKINIKELDVDNWRQLRIMNELRNRFAHGSNEFVIKKEILQELKREFGDNFISEIQNKGNSYLCKIENDFEPLMKFNNNMLDYMKQLENEYRNNISKSVKRKPE